jgi:hypothetical protein
MRPTPRTAGTQAGQAASEAARVVGPLPGRRGPARLRGYFRRPVRAAAAAASVAVAAGFALGYALMPASTGVPVSAKPPAASETFTGTNSATHVVATAALTPTSWGTSIQLLLRGIPQNVECRLVAHSRTGATEVTGVWDAWSEGPVSVPASAGWRVADIVSLQVVTGTKTLVTISTRGRPTATANS